jgi:hypothetical protein
MWDIDKQGQEELDKEIERFLAFVEQTEQESKERLAKTGEKPIPILIGVDRATRTIAIVPVDRRGHLPDAEGGSP